MKRLTIIAGLVVGLVLFSCEENSNPAEAEMEQEALVEALDVKVDNEIDPICNMKMTDGAVFDTIKHEYHLFGFCSTHCKDKFAANPGEYLDKM